MSSNNRGKAEAVKWIKEHFNCGATCLDVGAGDGKWANMLNDYLIMDAVEAFPPNVVNYQLTKKYRNTNITDIRTFKYNWYDLVIFGDVIEHLSVEDAQKVINYAADRCRNILIAVPFEYKQGAIYGNPYEVHIQDDLTPELFNKRYPGFVPIYLDYNYAYYINSEGMT